MKRKIISVDELRQLNEKTELALDETISMWQTAMRTLPLKSPEYKAICGAGYHLQKLQVSLAHEYLEATKDERFIPKNYVSFG